MRPSLLDPLFAGLTALAGVGPKVEKLYRRLFGREDAPARVIDLLFHLPGGMIDRRSRPKLNEVVPVYPPTEGLTLNMLRKAVEAALGKIPNLPEWQDAAWLQRNGFPAFAEAMNALHHPADPGALMPESPAWSRLAYDEFLAGQLALALVRQHQRSLPGRGSSGEGLLRAKVIRALPYALTLSQGRAVDDIVTDLARPQRMIRLLPGDVGSCKTVVALR